jgi:metal-dependent HD superfamily phosphatase/phosphodiesterase
MCDEQLKVRGFTEHGIRHAEIVSQRAGSILRDLGYSEREIELAKIAGFMHDIGNVVNRNDHANSGAILAARLLDKMNMSPKEISIIVSAIGNHDESTGTAVSSVSAALILSDKTDVHRGRVRNDDFATFDIHDRVNYAVTNAETVIDTKAKTITLELTTDSKICPLIEYFEIFLARMIMCRRAASYLNCDFKMRVNGTQIL